MLVLADELAFSRCGFFNHIVRRSVEFVSVNLIDDLHQPNLGLEDMIRSVNANLSAYGSFANTWKIVPIKDECIVTPRDELEIEPTIRQAFNTRDANRSMRTIK